MRDYIVKEDSGSLYIVRAKSARLAVCRVCIQSYLVPSPKLGKLYGNDGEQCGYYCKGLRFEVGLIEWMKGKNI